MSQDAFHVLLLGALGGSVVLAVLLFSGSIHISLWR